MSWLSRALANPNPTVATANLLAVMVASNQPLYPLTLVWVIGPHGWAAWPVLFSLPFFAAIPLITRTHPRLGCTLLPLTGIANSAIATFCLGWPSGGWIFHLPSLSIAAMILPASDRGLLIALSLLAFAALLFLPTGTTPVSTEEAATLLRLNAASALTLTAFAGWKLSR